MKHLVNMTIYQNYLIEERVEKDVKEHGGIKKTIKYLEKELKEMENLWSKYSCDSLGHGIICTRLKIQWLKETEIQTKLDNFYQSLQ